MAGTITLNGLVGYWNTQQGISGTTWQNIAPNTPGKYDGTINGTPVLDAYGLKFVDTTTYVRIPKPTELGNTGFTVEYRAKLTNLSTYPDTLRAATATGFLDFISYGYTSAWSAVSYSPGGTLSTMDTPGTFVDGTEYHIVYFVNATLKQMGMYIDGANRGTVDLTLAHNGNDILFLPDAATHFTLSDNQYPSVGYIDNIRLYNRVLDSTEITQNYNMGKAVGLTASNAVTGSVSLLGDATLSANSTVVSQTPTVVTASVSLSGDATLSAGLTSVSSSVVTLQATGDITATDSSIFVGSATLDAQTSINATLSASTGTSAVSGTVANGGVPIQGAKIQVINQSTNEIFTAFSNAGGGYNVNVTVGTYHVICSYDDGNGNKFASLSKPFITVS